VLSEIPEVVSNVYVVDDKCPDGTGRRVEENTDDERVSVLYHEENKGVGGATITGIVRALEDGADIVVKLDGDHQMNPRLISAFVEPIISGHADCTKGNRFFNIDGVRTMPKIRLIGNAVLSFMAKLSTGYWQIFDPNNGYVAIHAKVAEMMPWDKISESYFFETDLLFRLNTIRAVVLEIPMNAVYGSERSSLNVGREVFRFSAGHVKNFTKRIFYNYYLRNFSVASLEILIAVIGLSFGFTYGGVKWYEAIMTGTVTPAGTVMLAALPVLVGVQSLLAFINYDILSVPDRPLHQRLGTWTNSTGPRNADTPN